MTEQEMIVFFHERYNLSSNSNDDKEDDEVYLLLNAGVSRFVKTRYTGNNSRSIPFEADNKRSDDLRTLITTSGEIVVSVSSIDEIPNGKKYQIPSDYMFLIRGYCKIGNSWYSCDKIPLTDVNKWIETPVHKPIIRDGKLYYSDDSYYTLLVDPDNYSNLTVSKIQYLKKPDIIASGVDCNLPEHTHEEIVEIAVGLAIEELENQTRYQTHSDKLKTIE